jgi:hypothetical protein
MVDVEAGDVPERCLLKCLCIAATAFLGCCQSSCDTRHDNHALPVFVDLGIGFFCTLTGERELLESCPFPFAPHVVLLLAELRECLACAVLWLLRVSGGAAAGLSVVTAGDF